MIPRHQSKLILRGHDAPHAYREARAYPAVLHPQADLLEVGTGSDSAVGLYAQSRCHRPTEPSPLATGAYATDGASNLDPRGARCRVQRIAPQPCIRLGPLRTWTMKQPFASSARLRGGGHILPSAYWPRRSSCHRHLGSDRRRPRLRSPSKLYPCWPVPPSCRPQDQAVRHGAGGDKPPEGDQQLAGEGDDHRLAPGRSRLGSVAIPGRQAAALLEHQEPPG